ncbi:hypothetical protein [Runella zeae]|uniref:hypothetical protein n=1 Tax=Runella zeae TaxID=94255 RepID=UPI0004069BF0|nr:hypothetical protein [Runella zeae]
MAKKANQEAEESPEVLNTTDVAAPDEKAATYQVIGLVPNKDGSMPIHHRGRYFANVGKASQADLEWLFSTKCPFVKKVEN